MTPYFGMTGRWLTFWVTVACTTDMTLSRYDQGVLGDVIVTQDFLHTLGMNGKTSLVEMATAAYGIEADILNKQDTFFGAIATVVVGDLGLKKTILLGTTIMTFGTITQSVAGKSPRWLIAHDEIDEGRKILADVKGLDFVDGRVHNDVKDIQFSVTFEKEHGVS